MLKSARFSSNLLRSSTSALLSTNTVRFSSVLCQRKLANLDFSWKKCQFQQQQHRLLSSSPSSSPLPPHKPVENQSTSTPESSAIITIPNLLTMSRIVAAPGIAYLIYLGEYKLSLGILGVAALTDLADGWIARRFNMGSALGSFLDPLADKILVATLAVAEGFTGLISPWLIGLILLRDAGLLAGGLFLRAKLMETHKDLAGKSVLDTSVPLRVQPTMLSKCNTALQLTLFWLALGVAAFDLPSAHVAVDGLSWIVAATTFGSGLQYLLKPAVHMNIEGDESKKP